MKEISEVAVVVMAWALAGAVVLLTVAWAVSEVLTACAG